VVAPADLRNGHRTHHAKASAAELWHLARNVPSVDVITGVIKANIPARIAFKVAAKVDSRTILDAMGADKLLGKAICYTPRVGEIDRAQGAALTTRKFQSIVRFHRQQGKQRLRRGNSSTAFQTREHFGDGAH